MSPDLVSPDRQLIGQLRDTLAAAGDPERAAAARAYLKSAMPMYGLRLPEVRRRARQVVQSRPPASRPVWEATVRALYDEAGHREERYAALTLAGHRSAWPWQDAGTLPLYRHLVVTGAWWDLVDWVATGLVDRVLAGNPRESAPVVRSWADDADLWVRRTAVLSQVGAKVATDLDLLEHCLDANLERPEFWLRKACGWALRDLAPHRSDWVGAYVARNRERMSGLTYREATRRLPPPT